MEPKLSDIVKNMLLFLATAIVGIAGVYLTIYAFLQAAKI